MNIEINTKFPIEWGRKYYVVERLVPKPLYVVSEQVLRNIYIEQPIAELRFERLNGDGGGFVIQNEGFRSMTIEHDDGTMAKMFFDRNDALSEAYKLNSMELEIAESKKKQVETESENGLWIRCDFRFR